MPFVVINMKASSIVLRSTINIPIVILIYALALMICISPQKPDFSILLGIPPFYISGDIDYLLLGRWLVLVCTPLTVNGIIMERASYVETFSVVRFRNEFQYKKCIVGASFINVTIWAVLYVISGIVYLNSSEIILFSLVVVSSYLMWTVIGAVLYFFFGKESSSGVVVVLLVGGTYLLSERIPWISKFMPSIWGMVCRTSTYEENGCAALYFVVMNLILMVVGVFCLYWREKNNKHKP